MPKKRFSAEQIVTLLRQIEVLMAQGKSALVGLPGGRDIAAELRDELLNGEVVRQPEGGADCHRAMEEALQHCQTALGAPLSAAGTTDIRALGSPPR